AVMIVLAVPLTKAFVPTVTPAVGHAVGQVLVAMSLGLVPLGMMLLIKWVFFAYEDGRTVFWLQIPMSAVLVGGSLLVMALAPQQWWVVGIAGSMAASNAVTVALRARALHRMLGGLDGARLLRFHVRAALGALVAAAMGWGVLRLFGDLYGLSWGRAVLVCAAVGLVMLIVYIAMLRLLRVTELTALVAPLRRKLRIRR
ncbi:MAG: lipid II flippase MurJ, partial [Cellulomonadaceae bacterium]